MEPGTIGATKAFLDGTPQCRALPLTEKGLAELNVLTAVTSVANKHPYAFLISFGIATAIIVLAGTVTGLDFFPPPRAGLLGFPSHLDSGSFFTVAIVVVFAVVLMMLWKAALAFKARRELKLGFFCFTEEHFQKTLGCAPGPRIDDIANWRIADWKEVCRGAESQQKKRRQPCLKKSRQGK